MKENVISVIKTALILLIIGFVCTLLLSLCNYITKDTIAELTVKTENAAMAETLPEAETFEKIEYEGDSTVVAVHEGKASGKTAGYCVKVEPVGYGGAISMIVGVSADGTVKGVKIVGMSETPGLGAKAKDKSFTDAYIGKKSDIKVIKSGKAAENEIAAISGATITSKAVTAGVNAAIVATENLR